ncbi:MAG: DUF2141 domain-containing protein [Prolixibacteraceae bacterium]
MKHIITSVLLFLSILGMAQKETYNVAGRINAANPKGKIYVFLCNDSIFNIPFSGIDTLEFWVNYDKTQVTYEFKNVPAGRYAIRAYQDVNGNHKLDKWLFGPLEPWGFSYQEKMSFPPEFDDISFDLLYDMRINIVLGK